MSQRSFADGEVLRSAGWKWRRRKRGRFSLAKFLGFFVGIGLLVLLVGGVLFYFVHAISLHQDGANSQTMAQTDEAAANADAQREAMNVHHPW